MPGPFTLDVAFVPAEVPASETGVAIVVDVLRASSTIVTLFDRGCRSVGLAPSIDTGREIAAASGGRALLCGEIEGLPPYGFDFGNSPSEFAEMDLTGKHIVMCTTNGTQAVRSCQGFSAVLVGAIVNANAVVRETFDHLRELRKALIVCAGVKGRFVLDDAVAAGYLCHVLLNEARVRNIPIAQSNAASAAYRLYHSFPNLLSAFNESDSARALYPIRLGHDVAYCVRASISKRAPRLQATKSDWEDREGLYLLE